MTLRLAEMSFLAQTSGLSQLIIVHASYWMEGLYVSSDLGTPLGHQTIDEWMDGWMKTQSQAGIIGMYVEPPLSSEVSVDGEEVHVLQIKRPLHALIFTVHHYKPCKQPIRHTGLHKTIICDCRWSIGCSAAGGLRSLQAGAQSWSPPRLVTSCSSTHPLKTAGQKEAITL